VLVGQVRSGRADGIVLICWMLWIDQGSVGQSRLLRPSQLQDAFLLHLLELIRIDDVGGAFVFAGGLVVAASDFVLLVAGEAMLLDVLVAQFVLCAAFGVFTRNVGRMEDFAHRVARLRMRFERGFGHALNVFKGFAVAAVGEDFLINVSGHCGEES